MYRTRLMLAFLACLLLSACTGGGEPESRSFTVVVIPDTQNYVDFTLQKSSGFPIDNADLFMQQMAHIAGMSRGNGGNVAFVASGLRFYTGPSLIPVLTLRARRVLRGLYIHHEEHEEWGYS